MTETAKERIYREALEILRGMGINSKNRVMMPYGVAVTAQEFIEEKLEDAENMLSTTDKLSVEKLQEQLNSKVKALTEIRGNIEEHNQIYDLSVDTALLLEGIDRIALEAIGENHD
ncbi:hypothetical protein [Lactococcus lactis]|uniref:hypothetical protein n=1 Tax=Lactococcus lactis TaxID=1358 RepID=UPI003D0CC58B